MKIKIYQVNLDRDEHTAAFRGLYDKPMTEAGAPVIDSSIYDSVFEGEINCESLEDVFVTNDSFCIDLDKASNSCK